MSRSTFFVACALVLSFVYCAEMNSIQSQLRSFLNKDMVAETHAGYNPNAFSIPADLVPAGNFLSTGIFSVSVGYEATCTDSFLSVTAAADECIVDEGISYKLQLVKDSCAGAIIQYFFDDACTLFSGSSELHHVGGCNVAYEDATGRPRYASLSCGIEDKTARHHHAEVMAVTNEPSAEPTLVPTRVPTSKPTVRPSPVGQTAYPTRVTASTVTVSATQTINGLSYSTYLANQANNDAALKQTIAGCMQGVSANDFTAFDASTASRRLTVSLRVSRVLSTGSILLAYKLVTNSKLTQQELFDQLTNNVHDGTFNDLLSVNAGNLGAPDLTAATSDEVTPEQGNSDWRLGPGAIAAIVIGSVLGFVLVVLALYLMIYGAGGSSTDSTSNPHKAVEITPPTEL